VVGLDPTHPSGSHLEQVEGRRQFTVLLSTYRPLVEMPKPSLEGDDISG